MRYFFLAIMLMISFLIHAQSIEEGEKIFKNTCATCHTIGGGRSVGPDLENITEKRSKEYVFQFIQNSQKLINEGNEQAIEVFNEFNKIPMPPHNFDEAEMEDLYVFLAAASQAPTASDAETPLSGNIENREEIKTAETTAPTWFYIFTSLIFIISMVLIAIIFLLVKMMKGM